MKKNQSFHPTTNWCILLIAICLSFQTELSAYCTSGAFSDEDSRITNVSLNTLDVNSPSSCATYTDYTHFSTDLVAGETYNISVTHGTCEDFFQAWITVYIDFYQTGDFINVDEVFSFGPTSSLGPVNGTITVPSGCFPGSNPDEGNPERKWI